MSTVISANYFGKLYDWGSIAISILGDTQIGINKINVGVKKDSPNIYGYGQQPIGYYGKNFEYTSSVDLLYDQWNQISIAALALGLSPLEIPPFIIIMTLGFSQDPIVPPKVITLQNCRFTSDSFDFKQNDGGFYNDYPIAFAGKIEASS